MKAVFRRYTKSISSTSIEETGKVRFSSIYHILVQKETSGERMQIASNQEGDNLATEDYLEVPANGPSSIPFDLQVYLAKVNAGDGDKFIFNVLMSAEPGRGSKRISGD
jgi:hypothetical protein